MTHHAKDPNIIHQNGPKGSPGDAGHTCPTQRAHKREPQIIHISTRLRSKRDFWETLEKRQKSGYAPRLRTKVHVSTTMVQRNCRETYLFSHKKRCCRTNLGVKKSQMHHDLRHFGGLARFLESVRSPEPT